MKKTLMVLSFALCATFAFAQTNNRVSVTKTSSDAAVTREAAVEQQHAGFNGSIFTKDATLYSNGFEQEGSGYTTGVVGANEQVDGTVIPQHNQNKPFSRWNWLSGINAEVSENDYPCSYDVLSSYLSVFSNAETPNQGIMYMSMMDQIASWGGDGVVGNFDAYLQLTPISTLGVNQIDVRFFQFYRKFNRDQCFIDYRINNGAWSSVEFNVKNVDVNVNGSLRGWTRVMLPSTVGNQQTVDLRIRWVSESNVGGAYGYVFFLDDLSVLETPLSSFRIENNDYYEGFYQMIPQNLQLPVVWNDRFYNNGQLTHANLVGGIYTYDQGSTVDATPLVTVEMDSIVSAEKKNLVIDPYGWYDLEGSSHGLGYWEYAHAHGNVASLPTNNLGVRHFYSDITTSLHPDHIGDSVTFDTLRYEVNWETDGDGHQLGVWARDNGALRQYSYTVSGLVNSNGQGVWSNDIDEVMWSSAGYGVFTTYVTGGNIPAGWKVLGMEMVAATRAGMMEVGAKLEPVLFWDHRDSAGDLSFYNLATGASTYVTKASDFNSPDDIGEFLTEGYNTIRIMFPNQPVLDSFSSYRVGYELVQDAAFAIAQASPYFWVTTDNDEDSAVYYSETEGMQSYGNVLPIANPYTTMIHDVYEVGYYIPNNLGYYPMIRLLVGPGYWVPKTIVSYECDDENTGYFMDGSDTPKCGTFDSVPLGGSFSTYIMPVTGYEIDSVWINGTVAYAGIDYETRTSSDGTVYGILTLDNIQGAKTLRCKFKEQVGFDPIAAKVSMKLQPNPATSFVNVTLKGVSGNVNMSLIDMSGRVVSTNQFNAENGTNINVSNLAKGAYFVRITNNNFTKIEKLIVR